MPTTTVLHLGLPKTGTSSLQSVFSELSSQLEAFNIHYPVIFQQGFEWKAQRGLGAGNANIYENFSWLSDDPFNRLRQLIDDTRIKSDGIVLLSSEHLSALACTESFWQMLRSKEQEYDTKFQVVAYLRNPFDYFKSCYQQVVKLAGFTGNLDDSVDHFLNGNTTMTFIFLKNITKVFQYSRKYEIEFQLYSYEILKVDIVQHFFSTLLYTELSEFDYQPKRVNRSLQPIEIEFHRGVNSVSKKLGQLLGFERSDTLLGGLTRFQTLPQLPYTLNEKNEEILTSHFNSLKSELGSWTDIASTFEFGINRSNLPFSLLKEQEDLRNQIFELGRFVGTSYETGYINWDAQNSNK